MNTSQKHIIIAGISRGGKTTICRGISKRTNYNHMMLDPIVRGFQNNFPETGITHVDNIINVSKNLAPFINTIIEDMPYNEQPLLLDTYHIVPRDYISLINKAYCNIYFVGYPDISPLEKLREMRIYDKRKENTILTDEKLLEKCKEKINESKYIQRECEKYNLPFINTSYKRNAVIDNFINQITNLL